MKLIGPSSLYPGFQPTRNDGRVLNRVKVSDIRTSPFKRYPPLDEALVVEIAERLAADGLVTPIVVRKVMGLNDLVLIDGRHRLEAARRLGWPEIVCRVAEDCGDRQADDLAHSLNRCRRMLTAAEIVQIKARIAALREGTDRDPQEHDNTTR